MEWVIFFKKKSKFTSLSNQGIKIYILPWLEAQFCIVYDYQEKTLSIADIS